MKQIKRIHILLIILAMSCVLFVNKYPMIKENLFDISPEVKNINDNHSVKYKISSDCPKGTDEMLKDSKFEIEYDKIECELSDDRYVYYGEEIKVWSAIYGRLDLGDVQLGKSIHILQKANGDLFLDFGLAGLRSKINSFAKEYIGNKIAGSNDSTSHSVNEFEIYIEVKGLIYGPNDKGQYCGDFNALPPLVGEFSICQDIGNEGESHGNTRIIAGIPVYIAAKEIALEKSRSLYLDKVEYKNEVSEYMSKVEREKLGTGTYLSDYILKWRYYTSAGGYWLFVIREVENSEEFFNPSKLKSFDDMVWVKVQDDKKACVLETKPYSIRSLSMEAYDTPCPN